MSEQQVETHPVQTWQPIHQGARISTLVSLRAYEVYSHIYGPQEALITGLCRGGFSAGALIGFLYARSFPREEWHVRVDEAFAGMEQL